MVLLQHWMLLPTGQYALMDDIGITEQTVSGSIVTEDGITLTTKLLKRNS